MQTPLEVLAGTPFVSLTTFRRDGTPVPTPVWVVRIGDELMVWTNPEAGKVKRIRRDVRVQIGPCTRGGRPLGAPISGSARILEPAEVEAVLAALIHKYGFLAKMTALPNRLLARLGRPVRQPGGLAITPRD